MRKGSVVSSERIGDVCHRVRVSACLVAQREGRTEEERGERTSEGRPSRWLAVQNGRRGEMRVRFVRITTMAGRSAHSCANQTKGA